MLSWILRSTSADLKQHNLSYRSSVLKYKFNINAPFSSVFVSPDSWGVFGSIATKRSTFSTKLVANIACLLFGARRRKLCWWEQWERTKPSWLELFVKINHTSQYNENTEKGRNKYSYPLWLFSLPHNWAAANSHFPHSLITHPPPMNILGEHSTRYKPPQCPGRQRKAPNAKLTNVKTSVHFCWSVRITVIMFKVWNIMFQIYLRSTILVLFQQCAKFIIFSSPRRCLKRLLYIFIQWKANCRTYNLTLAHPHQKNKHFGCLIKQPWWCLLLDGNL